MARHRQRLKDHLVTESGWLTQASPRHRAGRVAPARQAASSGRHGSSWRPQAGRRAWPAQEAFTTIGDLLRSTIARPKVTAALCRAAVLIPGVTQVPDATTPSGATAWPSR